MAELHAEFKEINSKKLIAKNLAIDFFFYCSLQIGIRNTTIQNIPYKQLDLHAYKIHMIHQIKQTDHPKLVAFPV